MGRVWFGPSTGCVRQNENTTNIKILKEPLLVQKQTIPQQKSLDLNFNLAPWKWAWHHNYAATLSSNKITFFTPDAHMLFAASRCGALLRMPQPFSVCQIKAEIKGFLLRYRLLLYYLSQWKITPTVKIYRKLKPTIGMIIYRNTVL